MKNLTKIFMAVVAGIFAFSCVTDTTDDLNVKVEGQKGGVTELALSLEASRTHLGEKAEDQYPLYWSEGDAIAVNGTVSNPLEGVGESANAIFKFNEEIYLPFCVVYPASAAVTVEEGENSGEGGSTVEPEAPAPVTAYPVHFLAEQPYTVGTFAPQAAPMYGYASEEDELNVQMQHLTGVLRLAIKGENGEKVTSIKVKAEKGKIAGAYTVDCTTGVLTPSAEAVNNLTVTFAEPLALSAEATPVYVAVPAGNYGTFVITVNTEAHEKMTVKFDSDKKPINAGSVREFKEFTYEANNGDADEAFIIDSEEALIEFANLVGKGGFYPRTKAVVTADIAITKPWTPIQNFGAYEFDGGDCTISGLDAPLFASTAANIHDLTLTDVNYTVTDLNRSGAIACELYGDIDNCSVSGTININNTTFAPASPTGKYDDICHAGLVGYASGSAVTNCTNNINITITSLCSADKEIQATVGGVVGCVTNGCSFDYNVNNGNLEYVGTTHSQTIYISGIVGRHSDASNIGGVLDIVAISNCTNNGKISSSKDSKNIVGLDLCGIAGRICVAEDTVCTNLVNNGTITHNGSSKNITIGGIAGYNSTGTFTNCSNTAALTVAEGASSTGDTNVCGIFAGELVTGGLNTLTNTGALTVGKPSVVATGKVLVAGLVNTIVGSSLNKAVVTNCTNSAPINIGEWSNTTASGNGGRCLAGGLFYSVAGVSVTECYNQPTATITVNTAEMAALQMVGGVTAYVSATANNPVTSFSECENKADISVSSTGAVGKGAEIGGFTGEPYLNNNNDKYSVEFTDCKNSGNVTVSGTYSSAPSIGGFMGINNFDTILMSTCENSGTVTFSGAAGYVHLGGVIGYDGTNFKFVVDNCVHSGVVKCTSVLESGARIGGIIGTYNKDHAASTTVKNCKNLGTVALEGAQTVSANNYRYIVGGIVGYIADTLLTIEDCVNGSATDATKGVVTVGTAPSGVALGGILGLGEKTTSVSGCTNYGTVTQTGKGGYDATYRPHLGGIVGLSGGTITIADCKNYGTVCYGTVQATNKADIAGIIGETSTNGGLIKNCENAGTVKLTAPSNAETNVAGIIGMAQAGTQIINCKNLATGVVSFEGEHKGAAMCIGGIAGSTNAVSVVMQYCYNYGTVKQTKTTNTKGNLYIGGLNGYPYILGTMQYCGNHGPVIANSASNIYTGGLVGYPRTGASGNSLLDSYNAYDLVFTGNAAANYYAGGICGVYGKNKDVIPTIKNLVNLGNLTFKGTGATEKLGGIIGQSSNGVIENCVCHANLKALGKEGKIGMIMGIARAEATKASGCKIGGNLIFAEETKTETDDSGDEQTTTTETLTPITADNYFQYIYTTAVTQDVATEDGCAHLATKPATPVYTPAE